MGRPKKIDTIPKDELQKQLTPDEQEFIELIRACKDDPVLFGTRVLDLEFHSGQKVWLWLTCSALVAPSKRAAVFDLAFQEGLLIGLWADRAAFEKRILDAKFQKNILVPSNRWGKTFVTSVKHVWINYYKKGARGEPREKAELRCGTLNLSPHSNQCQAGYEYVLDILQGKLVWIDGDGKSKANRGCLIKKFFVRAIKAQRKIVFANFTSYRAVPTGEDQASSLAGTPYLYISYDEAAQSLHLKEELPAKIMSRLIDFGGPLDLVSTPEVDKPSHQYFSRIAKLGLKGAEGWWTLIGKLTDNTFLGAKERENVIETIRTTDPAKYRQVAFGEFVTTGAKMFDGLVIERLWDSKSPPQGALLDHEYVIAADWGFSDNGDPTVFYVLDYTENPRYRIVWREEIRGGSPFAVMAHAKLLQRCWNGAVFVHDSSAMGGAMAGKMLRDLDMTQIVDFNASGGNKAEMLFFMILVLTDGRQTLTDESGKVTDVQPEFGRLRSYVIPELEEQLGNYQYNPDKGVTDKKIVQDDVIALGMGLWYLERKLNQRKPKAIGFNPLAPTVDKIFPGRDPQSIRMRTLEIKERSIN